MSTDGRRGGQTSGWIQYTPIPPSVERGYNNSLVPKRKKSILIEIVCAYQKMISRVFRLTPLSGSFDYISVKFQKEYIDFLKRKWSSRCKKKWRSFCFDHNVLKSWGPRHNTWFSLVYHGMLLVTILEQPTIISLVSVNVIQEYNQYWDDIVVTQAASNQHWMRSRLKRTENNQIFKLFPKGRNSVMVAGEYWFGGIENMTWDRRHTEVMRCHVLSYF